MLAIAAAVFLIGKAAVADGNTASLRGYVRDESGRPLSEATVTITNHTGTITVLTDKQGFFSAISVPPGRTFISAEKGGFHQLCPGVIQLAANETSTIGAIVLTALTIDTVCVVHINLVRAGVTADIYDIF